MYERFRADMTEVFPGAQGQVQGQCVHPGGPAQVQEELSEYIRSSVYALSSPDFLL